MEVHDPLLYKQMFLNIPVGMFLLNDEKKIIVWNEWMVRHTLISSDAALGRELNELCPDLSCERYHWALDLVLTANAPQILSQMLNQFLIPITLKNPPSEQLTLMQQHVEILPIKQSEQTYALVCIFDVTDTVRQKQMLMKLSHVLEQESIRDELTQAYNRRFFWEWISLQVKQAKRDHHNLTCCILDLDFFKKINDEYGHDAGDRVLKGCVDLIDKVIRGSDLLVRYGGEEFVLILPRLNKQGSQEFAERVRVSIEQTSLSQLPPGSVTCSIGVAIWSPDAPIPIDQLLQQADKALYIAKADGRNCVRLHAASD